MSLNKKYLNDGLAWASRHGHAEVVALLLENGANVNAFNDYALIWSSYHGHKEVAILLLEHGKPL